MQLCRVNLDNVSEEEKGILNLMFFHPYDKLEEDGAKLIMNYGSGDDCTGVNDFGEGCKNCRYVPFVVRRILRRQKEYVFGKHQTHKR